MVSIALFAWEDCDALFELFKEWDRTYPFDYDLFTKSIRSILQDAGNRIIIAKEEHAIVGYAQIYTCTDIGFEPYYEVAQLLVSETMRNKGIGKLLMKKVEEIAKHEQVKEIKLSSQIKRSKAHVFYENMGYECYKISQFYRKKI